MLMSNYYIAFRECAKYYGERKTVGSLLLLWSVEILYQEFLRGRINDKRDRA